MFFIPFGMGLTFSITFLDLIFFSRKILPRCFNSSVLFSCKGGIPESPLWTSSLGPIGILNFWHIVISVQSVESPGICITYSKQSRSLNAWTYGPIVVCWHTHICYSTHTFSLFLSFIPFYQFSLYFLVLMAEAFVCMHAARVHLCLWAYRIEYSFYGKEPCVFCAQMNSLRKHIWFSFDAHIHTIAAVTFERIHNTTFSKMHYELVRIRFICPQYRHEFISLESAIVNIFGHCIRLKLAFPITHSPHQTFVDHALHIFSFSLSCITLINTYVPQELAWLSFERDFQVVLVVHFGNS